MFYFHFRRGWVDWFSRPCQYPGGGGVLITGIKRCVLKKKTQQHLANGTIFHSVCQVWLSSGPPGFYTFSYCAWLWNTDSLIFAAEKLWEERIMGRMNEWRHAAPNLNDECHVRQQFNSLVFRVKAVCFEVKISVETCSLLDSVWQAMLLLSCFVYWRKLGQPFTWRWEFGCLLLVINSLTLFIHDFQQSWWGRVLTDSEVTSMLGVLQ